MSGYGNLRQRTHDASTPPPRDESMCYANGCPCKASLSVSGGRFMCSAHAFANADDWPGITEKLMGLRWLMAFTDDVQRIEQVRLKDMPDWRAYATQFWKAQDEFCVPHPKEECMPYLIRMRAELLYRLGQRKRPAPRIPEPVKSRGNAGRLLQRRAA